MFIITERQYNIVMQQAQMSYPYEAGGVLGGREGVVMGVLPIFNKTPEDPKESFGMDSADIQRAHDFLAKHGLGFYGIYHSHPRGIAFPSEADLSHHQKYLFIISLADRYNPVFAAYQIEGKDITLVNIRVVSDKGFSVLDITTDKPHLAEHATRKEMQYLSNLIENIIEGKVEYPKFNPTIWDSTFSTLA